MLFVSPSELSKITWNRLNQYFPFFCVGGGGGGGKLSIRITVALRKKNAKYSYLKSNMALNFRVVFRPNSLAQADPIYIRDSLSNISNHGLISIMLSKHNHWSYCFFFPVPEAPCKCESLRK